MPHVISNYKKSLLVIGEEMGKRDSMMTDYDDKGKISRPGSIMINTYPMTIYRDLKTDLRMTHPIKLNQGQANSTVNGGSSFN